MNQIFFENPAYLTLAIVGSLLYVLKMIMFLVGSHGDGALDDVDGRESFSLISTQSILAFLMGTGWIGLAATREWQLGDMLSLICAVAFGALMLLFSAFLTFKIQKLNSSPSININEAIGKTGRAYTNIPAKGDGVGQVEITVGHKQQILQASSSSKAINSFDSIIVEQVDDLGNLIIKKS